MSIPMPTNYTPVQGSDSYINLTSTGIQTTLEEWKRSWPYILALLHLYNEADVQLACVERDNAKHTDTITKAQTMHFMSQSKIMRAKQFSGVVQDD